MELHHGTLKTWLVKMSEGYEGHIIISVPTLEPLLDMDIGAVVLAKAGIDLQKQARKEQENEIVSNEN